jgi:hypothetical protein
MTYISSYASNKILDFILGRESLVMPSIFFLGLSTTPLGNEGIGATEPTDVVYQRMPIPNDKNSFSAAYNKVIGLTREFVYPTSTVSWNRCTHFVIYDNSIGGNVWFYGELRDTIDVEVDTAPFLEANANQFSLDICGGSTTDMALTTFASNGILNHVFGRSPLLVPPTNYYMGVSTTAVSTEGIGMTEPTNSEYKRLQMPNDKNSFTFAANKSLAVSKDFGFAPSQTPWGLMTHFFLSDAPVGGNVWWCGKLLHNRNVEISTTLIVPANGFRWTLDTCITDILPTS